MKVFLLTTIVIHGLALILTLGDLAFGDYPRARHPVERWADVLTVLVAGIFGGWALWLVTRTNSRP